MGSEAEVRAAWLRFPSFELELLTQIYQRTGPNSYRYESGGGSFVANLEVNDAALVTLYPELWIQEHLQGEPYLASDAKYGSRILP